MSLLTEATAGFLKTIYCVFCGQKPWSQGAGEQKLCLDAANYVYFCAELSLQVLRRPICADCLMFLGWESQSRPLGQCRTRWGCRQSLHPHHLSSGERLLHRALLLQEWCEEESKAIFAFLTAYTLDFEVLLDTGISSVESRAQWCILMCQWPSRWGFLRVARDERWNLPVSIILLDSHSGQIGHWGDTW